MSKYRNLQPLHTTIVELLYKKGGSSTDTEIYKDLQNVVDDLSFKAYNRNLMDLELNGIIRVTTLTKNRRNIEVIKK
jgi:hypothetical protein